MALTISLILSGSVLATFLGINIFNFIKRMLAQNKARQLRHIHSQRISQDKANSKDKISRQEKRAERQARKEANRALREEEKERKKLHKDQERKQKDQEKLIKSQNKQQRKEEKRQAREDKKAQKDLEKRTKFNTDNIKLSSEVDDYMRKIVNAKVKEATALRSQGKNLSKADKKRLAELEKEIDTFMKHNDLDPQPTISPEKEKRAKEVKTPETLITEQQSFAHETINQKAQRATELANKPFLTMTDRQELATLNKQIARFYEGNPTFENGQPAQKQFLQQTDATVNTKTDKEKSESRIRKYARGAKQKASDILSADITRQNEHDNSLHFSP